MTSKASQEHLERLRRGKAKREKECGDVTAAKEESVSVTAPSTQCDDVTNQQCHTFPRQECKDVPQQRCHQVPKVECQDLNRQSCQEVPVRDCQNKPRRVCSLVPKIQTKEVSDRQCSQVQRQVCNSVPKQVFYLKSWPLLIPSIFNLKYRCATT